MRSCMQGRRSQEGVVLPLNDRIDRIRRVTNNTTDSDFLTSEADLCEDTMDETKRNELQNHNKVHVPRVMRDYARPVIVTSPLYILLDDLSRNYEFLDNEKL
ncbi:hypothetical protein ACOSQ3_016411 [Xanthoceras sorbifolium]